MHLKGPITEEQIEKLDESVTHVSTLMSRLRDFGGDNAFTGWDRYYSHRDNRCWKTYRDNQYHERKPKVKREHKYHKVPGKLYKPGTIHDGSNYCQHCNELTEAKGLRYIRTVDWKYKRVCSICVNIYLEELEREKYILTRQNYYPERYWSKGQIKVLKQYHSLLPESIPKRMICKGPVKVLDNIEIIV